MRVAFFDFDGCIMDCPLPDEGKKQWSEFHGVPYPHKGWWSKKESLCLEAFDIQPFPSMDQVVREAIADPHTRTVLLTNRMGKIESHVRAVLDRQGYELDSYTFKWNGDNKGQRIRKYLERNCPNATEAVFYDDDITHLLDTKDAMRGHTVRIKLFHVVNGEIVRFH